MSKSFDVKVSFNFRATVSDEHVAEILKDLEHYRAGAGATASPIGDAAVRAYDEGGVEGLIAFILRIQVKEARALVMEDAGGGDWHHFSPFHTEIAPRG